MTSPKAAAVAEKIAMEFMGLTPGMVLVPENRVILGGIAGRIDAAVAELVGAAEEALPRVVAFRPNPLGDFDLDKRLERALAGWHKGGGGA